MNIYGAITLLLIDAANTLSCRRRYILAAVNTRAEEKRGKAAWEANDPNTTTGMIRRQWEKGDKICTVVLPIGYGDPHALVPSTSEIKTEGSHEAPGCALLAACIQFEFKHQVPYKHQVRNYDKYYVHHILCSHLRCVLIFWNICFRQILNDAALACKL